MRSWDAMKIGLLCGREFSFPPAFIDRVNAIGQDARHHRGVRQADRHEDGRAVRLPRSSSIASRTRSSTTARYLKHAVLEGTYVINNPFWWTADDKFFNYAVAQRLGVAMPKTVVLPQKAYPAGRRPDAGVAAQPRLSDRLGRAARLRRPAGDPEAVLGRRLEARLQGARRPAS